jgi:hypothetical protein
MPTVYLSPFGTLLQGVNDTATAPLSGALIWTYLAGTSTPQATYTDSTGTTPNSNPIQLTSAGRLPQMIWQPVGVKIKVQVSTNAGTVGVPVFGNQIGPTFDQLAGIGDPTGIQQGFYGGTDTGAANAYVLTIAGFPAAYTAGQIIYWVPANTNTTSSTMNVNGLGAVSIVNPSGAALTYGQLVAGQVTAIAYTGSNFVLVSSSAVNTGTFTGTLTGMTATTNVTVTYTISGRVCILNAFGTGTSNSTAMTMTGIPNICNPATKTSLVMSMLEDSGSNLGGWSQVTTGNQINFGTGINNNQTGFTNSGTKGLPAGWTVVYTLT